MSEGKHKGPYNAIFMKCPEEAYSWRQEDQWLPEAGVKKDWGASVNGVIQNSGVRF